jgi:hypothetical protein
MVDRASIKDLLISYFEVDGRYTINDDLSVDTEHSVIVRNRGRSFFPNGKLPIKFGTVGGDFDVVNTGLTTLVGAPHTVGDTFMCSANKLTTLEHGPQKVRYGYVIGTNPLINLEGFPTSNAPDMVSMYYMPHLPLLKLLSCEQIRLYPPADRDTDAEQLKVDQIIAILDKHKGSGKPGALKCAGELIRAGFKENARW